MKVSRDAYSLLASLGISFKRELDFSLTPEECLISLIEDHNLIENRRLLSLTSLAFHTYQDLFRPDLLNHLARRMTIKGQATLGGILFRGRLNSPNRWDNLRRHLQKTCTETFLMSSQRLLDARGRDEYFSVFGIQMTPLAITDDRKLLNQNWFLKQNFWLGLRILFGPSTRADINSIRRNFLESNPNRIAKRFNASTPSITKIWNDVIEAQALGYV